MAKPPISRALRLEVLESGPCAYCGDWNPTHVDHVIPRCRGGTDDRGNLVPACSSCNIEKLDFTPDEWREWRESKGYGWPPKTRAARFMEIWEEHTAGMSPEEKRRLGDNLIAHWKRDLG